MRISVKTLLDLLDLAYNWTYRIEHQVDRCKLQEFVQISDAKPCRSGAMVIERESVNWEKHSLCYKGQSLIVCSGHAKIVIVTAVR